MKKAGPDIEQIIPEISLNKIPEHVAVIMDGNGRWAKERGLERSAGHVEGVITVRRITETASQLGIKYLTLYTFSTENWKRPKPEVDSLMHLIVSAIEKETKDLIKNNVRLIVIGERRDLPQYTLERLEQCISDTSHCNGLTLILAISYSSRWEITEACRKIAALAASGEINADEITVETVRNNMCAPTIPDPDLLIRTGGDYRVSNFLLWQIAYAEIIVTQTYWPDYTSEEFVENISEYQKRQRRFGLTGEQIRG